MTIPYPYDDREFRDSTLEYIRDQINMYIRFLDRHSKNRMPYEEVYCRMVELQRRMQSLKARERMDRAIECLPKNFPSKTANNNVKSYLIQARKHECGR